MNKIVTLASPCEHIVVQQAGPMASVTFNRPKFHNALNSQMWQALPEIMEMLGADNSVRVIVFAGAGGKAFAAGADIAEFAEVRADAATAQAYEASNARAFAAIASVPKPVIAKISGYCIGGGLAVALACDLRIADTSSVFGLPPARLGLGYPQSGLEQLLAAVSVASAKELIFTAQKTGGQRALAMGLINELCSTGELDMRVEKMCAAIADNAPLTLKASKAMLDALHQGRARKDAEALAELVRICFDSHDYREGCSAFMEKRKPVFEGR